MPGGEKLQYPFPYKNGSGLGGDEGDLEVDNLIVNGDALIEGDLTVEGTITGDFVGDFTGPFFTATDDDNQWRTTATLGTTSFVAENQTNPTYNFKNKDGVVTGSNLSAGSIALNDSLGDYVTVGMDSSYGRIRSSAEAFGLDLSTPSGKQIKLDTVVGTGSVEIDTGTLTANTSFIVLNSSGNLTVSTTATTEIDSLALTVNSTTTNLNSTGSLNVSTGSTTTIDTGSLVVNTSFLGDVDINQNGIGHINLAASVGTIELSTGVGALKLSAGLGGIDVSALAGLVSVEALVGGIDLTTGIGEIGLTTAGGAMLLTTGAGAITVTTALGDILISAAAGGIEIVTAVGEITIGGAGAVTVGALGAVTVGGVGLLTLGGVGATTLLSGIFTGTTGIVNWATPTFSVIGDFDASNIVANSTTNATSISTGSITTPGGAGIAQDVFIGGDLNVAGDTTYTGDTTFTGQVDITNTTSIPPTSNNVTATSSALNVDGSVGIYGDRSFLLFQQATLIAGSVGPPSTITRSLGTRIVVSPIITPISVEYAIGIDLGSMWYSVPTSSESHVFYCGPNQIGNFTGNGLTVSVTTNSTSTSTGALRSFGGLGVAHDSYLGGSLNVNGTSTLTGQVTVNDTTSIGNSNTVNSNSGSLNVGGDLTMFNNPSAVPRLIIWPQPTSPFPPTVSTRSTGTRIVLSAVLGASQVDYAIGVMALATWYSVGASNATHNFYCASTMVASLGATSLILNPATNSTSTTTGSLITAGGVGIVKDVFIGGLISVAASAAIGTALSVGTTLTVAGQSFFTNTTTLGNSNTVNATSGAINVNGSISMYGANVIAWPPSSFGIPATTTRSVGTRIIISPALSVTNIDYAIGVSSSALWYSTDQPNSYHVFYCGPSQVMSLNSIAMTIIPTTTSSSTATGALVVGGGVGVGGSAFIGAALNVAGSSTLNTLSVGGRSTMAGLVNITDTTSVGNSNAVSTSSGSLNVGGDLTLFNNPASVARLIIWGLPSTLSAPTFTTRSAGTRLVLYPLLTASRSDNAFGVMSTGMWYSVGITGSTHNFYCGITSVATLGTTSLTLTPTTASTSTITGALITGGGAGIAGDVFIGATTNSAGVLTVSASNNSTSTSSGSIITAGGAGIAKDVLIGGLISVVASAAVGTALSVGTSLSVTGQSFFTNTTTIGNSNTVNSVSGAVNVNGSISMYGNNEIAWPASTVGVPTTTTRSAGTRLVIWPGLSATTVDYAIGTSASVMWYSTDQPNSYHVFYCGPSQVMSVNSIAMTIIPTTVSSSTSTGALIVGGGAGIGGNVFIGGTLNVAGSTVITGGTTYTGAQIISNATHIGSSNAITSSSGALNVNGDIAIYGSTSMFGFVTGTSAVPAFTTRSLGTRIILSPSISGTTTDYAFGISATGTWYSVPTTALSHTFYCANTPIASISNTAITFNTATASTSTTTGSIVTPGGVGIGGAAWIGGLANLASTLTVAGASTLNTLTLTSSTASSSTTTGSLVTPGGVGIGGATWIGGLVNVGSSLTVVGATTLSTVNITGSTSLSTLTLTSSTASTSTSTGSFVTPGGVGIGGAAWIGGLANVASTLTVGGASTLNSTLNVTGQNTLSNSTKIGSSTPSSTNGGVNINGDISLYNVTSNLIGFNTNGVAAPTTTTRSLGTKLLLYPSLSGTQTDYAIGIQAGAMWYSTDLPSDNHIFYCGTTSALTMNTSTATFSGDVKFTPPYNSFTPTFSGMSGGSITITSNTSTYTVTGNLCYANYRITFNSTSSGGFIQLSLPVTPHSGYIQFPGFGSLAGHATPYFCQGLGSTFVLQDYTGTQASYSVITGQVMSVGLIYAT